MYQLVEQSLADELNLNVDEIKQDKYKNTDLLTISLNRDFQVYFLIL